ncbi:MAG: hypothetical protein GY844_29295 [Bradyrhizobium sp.]|nr:hypothetical protein [Bradyrhizobium sp.]
MVIDLHSHVLPGLDDGAETLADALAMCRIAVADGTTTLVATPHMMNGVYSVSREDVLGGVAALRARLAAEGLPLEILPGGDVHVDRELPALLRDGQVMTVGDAGRYMLLELPHDLVPPGISGLLFEIQLAGVTPIVTHPERQRAVQEKPDLLREWVKTGSLVQVTAMSLTGAFGRAAETCAWHLLQRRLAHLVASDAHSPGARPPGLSAARQVVEATLGTDEALEIFDRRPRQVVDGEEIDLLGPQRSGRRWWPFQRR